MDLMHGRVRLTPRPLQSSTPALEVAMLGHAPGKVRLSRLSDAALLELHRLGYGKILKELRESISRIEQGEITDDIDEAELDALENLYHLPIALHSQAEFDDLFPQAKQLACSYKSAIAGELAWLPQAVEDFFANGGEKVWIIRIPQALHQDGFMAAKPINLHEVESLQGLAVPLAIQEVGLIAFPDLERISLAEELQDIPRNQLKNPDPQFLPCNTNLDDDHRERRYSNELPHPQEHYPVIVVIRTIAKTLHQYRPDMQCLYSLPLEYSSNQGKPIMDQITIDQIESMKFDEDGYLLRHVQLIFPYLRSMRHPLVSGVGLIAGKQAHEASAKGIWSSMAGLPLLTTAHPYPHISTQQIAPFRDKIGVGLIVNQSGKVCLDDERLAMPALHKRDYRVTELEKYKSYRSGEVARFLGYLQRQLRELGEMLIFNMDNRDPRPRFVLEEFFQRLYQLGALRGEFEEQAFQIRQNPSAENVIDFDIEIAPTFPIDKFHLTFTNRTGEWLAEIANG